MQQPSTLPGAPRRPRKLSPINAAQRAGYMLDTAPATPTPPATNPAKGQPPAASAAAQAH